MAESSPFLTISNTILWLKVMLTGAALVLLFAHYRRGKKAGSAKPYSYGTKLAIGFAVVLSFAVFHDLGTFRAGSFVHHGEMFHYYLGSKYFAELGYRELYNAVIVADAEQDDLLANIPFYNDLKSYQKLPRDAALRDADRIKGLFSEERWNAFKEDVSYFKTATGMPRTPGVGFLLMDHGYNASPLSTFVLGGITNLFPVAQLRLLAMFDVLLVLAMVALVFRTFGFETGALFSVYFFVNILSGHEYVSGSLLRYDWLLYIVVAVCLLERGRPASAAFFLTLASMLRIFPAVLFLGVAVSIAHKAAATRALDRSSKRFVVAAGATALALFCLPAVSLGSVAEPWQEFYAKARLHDSGVYVNHLGLRGVVLFEPTHLSLEKFAQTYNSADIVRRWQDVKEYEFSSKRPLIVLASILVLVGLAAIIWKRKEAEGVALLWATFLIYTTSYLSTYYYAFLCLLVLLFFRRAQSRDGFVPLAVLLVVNIAALVTDSFKPSPIVFFTLINIYLFIGLSSILAFALYASLFSGARVAAPDLEPARSPERGVGRRRRPQRARGK